MSPTRDDISLILMLSRKCTFKMVAFGGHTAQSRDGVFVVSREDKRRLYVSDILSQRTADFLMTVYNKLSKSRQRELPESKHVTDRPNSRPAE